MIIYNSKGNKIVDAPVTKLAKYNWQLMANNYVQLSFELFNYIIIPKGSYIEYQGMKFYMIRNFEPDDLSNKEGYKYEPIFDSAEYWLQTRNVFYIGQNLNEAVFTSTTNIAGFAEIIISCATQKLSSFTWSFSIHSDVDAIVAKTIAFNGETLFDACTAIAQEWETEWWGEVNDNAIIIHFGKLQVGNGVNVRLGEIAKSFPSRRGEDANFGTRFYIYGSSRNLTSEYGQLKQGGATNHISELRLRLPHGQNYIDAWEDLADEDVVEKLVFFDDIYPKNTDKITKVSTVQRAIDNSDDTFTAYVIEASGSPFKETDIIEGETIKIIFTSGVLNGFEFEVAPTSDFENKKFELVATHVDDGNGGVISTPGGILIPATDDNFIMTGVKLPLERVAEAEQKLLEAGKAYAIKNSNDTTLYECPTNPVYCEANKVDLTMGQCVILHHERFGAAGRKSRLQGFEKLLYNPYISSYQFGDNTPYSKFGEIKNSVEGVAYNNRLGVNSGAGIYVIALNDTTTPTDFNVNSAKRSDYKYLNKQTGGNIKGDLDVDGNVSSDVLQNSTFTAGQLGSGYQIKQHSNGQSYMEIDNLLVRREMVLNRLTIAEIKSVGGTILLSLASMVISKVIEQTGSYRCYFNTDKGTINNDFAKGDQVICRRWTGSNMKYYWRLVTAIGTDYIELSKTDKDGSGLPELGDELIQLGNRSDVNRQHAIMLSAYGSDAPSIKQYSKINSYNLTGKEKTVISPEGNKFTGDFIIESNGSSAHLYKDRGTFTAGTTYYLRDRVNYNSSYWVCTVSSTVQVPGTNASVWRKETSGQADIDKAIDAIEVGGVNLVNDTSDENKTIYNQAGWWYQIQSLSLASLGLKSGDILTCSVFIDSWTHVSNSCFLRVNFNNNNFNTKYGTSVSVTGGRSVVTFTIPNGVSSIQLCLTTTYNTSIRTSATYRQLKLEKGNKATDWSPSSADVQKEASNYADAQDAKVRTETNASLKVLSDSIALKTNKSDFDALGNRVKNAESEISLMPSKITLAVNNVEVGVGNLVNNSGVKHVSNAYGFGWRKVNLEKGKVYTFTVSGLCDQRAISDGKRLVSYLFREDWSFSVNVIISSTIDDVKQKIFTAPVSGSYTIQHYLHSSGGSRAGKVTVNWCTVHNGNKAPKTWMPSLVDVQREVSNYADDQDAKIRIETQAKIDILSDNITLKVSESTHVATRKVRYIRDWLNGSNKNTANHWVEIQAFKGSTNVAAGKFVTPISNWQRVTDGSITSGYASGGDTLRSIIVDLGSVQEIDYVKIWHYFLDGRVYNNTKTEVSADGKNWLTLFDSALEGKYKETSAGRTYYVNDYTQQVNREKELVSLLSIDANKISLASKTIELNGTTIAKAIEAEDLEVGSSTGASQLKVKKNGTFYARGSNGEKSSLKIDSERQEIELKSSGIESEVRGESGQTTIRLSGQTGGLSVRGETSVRSNSVTIVSSGGVYANTALQDVLPLTTGVTARASIVGLGVGSVGDDLDINFVAGVYGRASNILVPYTQDYAGVTGRTINPAPAYGGYFEILKASGLVLNQKLITAKSITYTTLSNDISSVVSISSTIQYIRLRDDAYAGTVVKFRQAIGGGFIRIERHNISTTAIFHASSAILYFDIGSGYSGEAICLGKVNVSGLSKTVWLLGKYKT